MSRTIKDPNRHRAARVRPLNRDAQVPPATNGRAKPRQPEAPAPSKPEESTAFPVIVIGTPDHGLEALAPLLRQLPADTGMAFVLVQRLDPTCEGLPTSMVSRFTAMPVAVARNNLKLRPNHLYIVPPDMFMVISKCRFKLTAHDVGRGMQSATDCHLRSLADDAASAAAGFMLVGTGRSPSAEAARLLICVTGKDGGGTWFNQHWLDFAGRPLEHELGEGWLANIHSGDRDRFLRFYRPAFEARTELRMECRLRGSDGEWRRILIHCIPLVGAGREFNGCLNLCTDVTERKQVEAVLRRTQREQQRKQAEAVLRRAHQEQEELVRVRTAALTEANQKLQELSAVVLRTQETERKRISRELHDDVGQVLTMASLVLRDVEKNCAGNDVAQRKVDEVQSLLRRSMDSVHHFARELRPSALDELGLVPALRSLVSDVAARSGLDVRFRADPFAERLGSEEKVVLFRVTQESLNNVVKHSRATGVRVTLSRSHGNVSLVIADNGQSFDPSHVSPNRRHRLGLVGMEERVRLVNGRFTLSARPGEGTTVRVEVSVKAAAPTVKSPGDRDRAQRELDL